MEMKKQRSATEGKANEELDNIRATPIEDVAKRLEIVVERHKALCPFHNDRHPSLRFKGNRFKCFACGESGDVIDLVMRYLNIGFREAVEWIGDTAPLPPGGGVSHAVGKSGDLEIPPPGGGGLSILNTSPLSLLIRLLMPRRRISFMRRGGLTQGSSDGAD